MIMNLSHTERIHNTYMFFFPGTVRRAAARPYSYMYNTYLKYVFITSTLCIQLCFRYTKIHCTMYFSVSGPNTLNTQCI